MKVIVFGATGMVGQGALRAALEDPGVAEVLTVGRRATGRQHPKLREITVADLSDYTAVEDRISGYDACLFCLGVSAAGLNEAAYRRITYDFTLAAARTLARLNPDSAFVYVSGRGTDADGRAMWARVKGETENALLDLPLKVYLFRPGYIQPVHGARSRTRVYRWIYAVGSPLYPLLRRLFPDQVTTTDAVGRAMLAVCRDGAAQPVLSTQDINAAAT